MEFVLELLNEQKKLLSIELGECEGKEHEETKKRLDQVTYAINLLSSQNAKDIKANKENKAWEKYRQAVYDASEKEICKCKEPKPMYNSEPEFCSGCGNQIIKNKTDKEPIEFTIENINGVIKFTPDNIEINKKIGLVRAYPIGKEIYIDISINFQGFLFKRGLDAYGGQNDIQNFYNFKYFVKDIKELEFMNVPENVKLKVQLFEALPINPSRKLFESTE